MWDSRQFSDTFSDGRSRTLVDPRGMLHGTDIRAKERRGSAMCPWCAGTVSPAGLFDIPFIRLVEEVAYVRRLYELFWKYHERSAKEEGFDWPSLCCIDAPYDKSY